MLKSNSFDVRQTLFFADTYKFGIDWKVIVQVLITLLYPGQLILGLIGPINAWGIKNSIWRPLGNNQSYF